MKHHAHHCLLIFLHQTVVNLGQRTLDLVKRYATHDYDAVLDLYYAKARMYDPANRRFLAVDLVKGQVNNPLSLVSYLYCVDNPHIWVDPLGLVTVGIFPSQPEIELIAASEYVLKRGCKSDAVRTLQQFLAQAGYYPEAEIDGSFGRKTDAAFRAFQDANDLDVDGSVGPKTWAKILSGNYVNADGTTSTSEPTPTTPSEPDPSTEVETPEPPYVPELDDPKYLFNGELSTNYNKSKQWRDIARVQLWLTALDLYEKNSDRKFRHGTKAAVEAFQDLAGLKVTGKVDEVTWYALQAEYFKLSGTCIDGFLADSLDKRTTPAVG